MLRDTCDCTCVCPHQGCADGGITPPIFSKLPEGWSKVSHAARELAKKLCDLFLFSVIIVGQLVRMPPPLWRVSRTHHWSTYMQNPQHKPKITRANITVIRAITHAKKELCCHNYSTSDCHLLLS